MDGLIQTGSRRWMDRLNINIFLLTLMVPLRTLNCHGTILFYKRFLILEKVL